MPHDEHGLHGVGLRDLILRQQRGVEPARAGDAGRLHQGLVGEARLHPVVVDLPHPAPMPPGVLGRGRNRAASVVTSRPRSVAPCTLVWPRKMLAPAAGMPDIAGGEQQDAARADVRRSDRELGLPHRPDQRRRPLLGEYFGDVLDLRFGQAGDALDLVGRPLRDLLADLVHPVDALADEFLVLPAVLEDVPEHPVDRRNVRAGAHPHIFGRVRRRARHPRIDDDHVGAVELLALENVLQRHRMRLGGIAAHDHDGPGVADIVVAVGHRAVAPGIGHAGDGGGMTDARLMVGIVGSPERGELAVEIGGFVGELGGAEPVDRFRTRPSRGSPSACRRSRRWPGPRRCGSTGRSRASSDSAAGDRSARRRAPPRPCSSASRD